MPSHSRARAPLKPWQSPLSSPPGVDAAGEPVLDRCERRLDLDAAPWRRDLEGDAGLGEEVRRAERAGEGPGLAVKVERALPAGLVGEARLLAQRRERLAAVQRQPQLAPRVGAIARGRAVAQEARRPGPEPRVPLEAQAHPGVGAVERLEEAQRCVRRRPREAVAGRDDPGVGEARLLCRAGPALDDHDVVAVLGEVVSGGHPDHACPEDHDPHRHGVSLSRHRFARRGRGHAPPGARLLAIRARYPATTYRAARLSCVYCTPLTRWTARITRQCRS